MNKESTRTEKNTPARAKGKKLGRPQKGPVHRKIGRRLTPQRTRPLGPKIHLRMRIFVKNGRPVAIQTVDNWETRETRQYRYSARSSSVPHLGAVRVSVEVVQPQRSASQS